MTSTTDSSPITKKNSQSERSRWKRLFYIVRSSKPAMVGALISISIIIIAFSAPLIAPHDPNSQNLVDKLSPPAWTEDGTYEYLLGTDHLGRDILSRMIYGARTSLLAAFFAATLAGFIGCILGLFAGYFGGFLETIIMRIVDIQLSFPMILLALALIAALGPNFRNLVIVMGVTGWMGYARVVRASTLSIKNREFVIASRAIGSNNFRIMFKHILPNILTPIIVLFTLEVPRLILVESGLSYLGLGSPPHIATWGRMLSDGRAYMTVAYWIVTYPGIALMFTVLGINLFGDGLRDALDPKLRLDVT